MRFQKGRGVLRGIIVMVLFSGLLATSVFAVLSPRVYEERVEASGIKAIAVVESVKGLGTAIEKYFL